jgi:hypothetical protein
MRGYGRLYQALMIHTSACIPHKRLKSALGIRANVYVIIGTVEKVTATMLEVKQSKDGKVIQAELDARYPSSGPNTMKKLGKRARAAAPRRWLHHQRRSQ